MYIYIYISPSILSLVCCIFLTVDVLSTRDKVSFFWLWIPSPGDSQRADWPHPPVLSLMGIAGDPVVGTLHLQVRFVDVSSVYNEVLVLLRGVPAEGLPEDS